MGEDPTGIAPERALVFETAGRIQDFARAAREIGLEVIAEIELEDADVIPEGFAPAGGATTISQTLYTTMPTLESARQILTLWNAHQADQPAPRGAAPWWRLFDLLLKLRTWGPEDRLPASARETIEARLPASDEDEVNIEFEIWPSANRVARTNWRDETEGRILALGGRIVHRSSISGSGFVYEAVLARLPAGVVRALLTQPHAPDGLAWIKGVQFILPQTIAQAMPNFEEEGTEQAPAVDGFDPQGPIRVVLLDGVPVSAHPVLDGAVVVEDVHDLVPLSLVENRHHATSMASLILRGDLQAGGNALSNTRLVSVPVAIDNDRGGAVSPPDKLFVDVVHVALTGLFVGENALAPEAFVVNLSMGIPERRFAGQISSLARLLDWWACEHGLLFVISAGNITDELILKDVGRDDFIAADIANRRTAVRRAIRDMGFGRSLMAPAESLNGLTVGAISEDIIDSEIADVEAGAIRLEGAGERHPAISSALGLGAFRTIKPDLLESGGIHGVRAVAVGNDTRLIVVKSQHSGLVVASPWPHYGGGTKRAMGTSCATALTTRAILLSALALTMEEGGPYSSRHLTRRDLALLTRALAVNGAHWPEDALALYSSEVERLGPRRSFRAKEEVARQFGHGVLAPSRMQASPASGVTLVGLGDARKDQAQIFELPLPLALSGDSVPRSMRVTLAWFAPVSSSRSRYRLASLEAVAADSIEGVNEEEDKGWRLLLKGSGLDEKIIGRGTVWSRRLIQSRLACPVYDEDRILPLRVQCMDSSGGGLSPDIDIRFAIAVTLEVEAEVQYDIHQEARDKIEPRLRR